MAGGERLHRIVQPPLTRLLPKAVLRVYMICCAEPIFIGTTNNKDFSLKQRYLLTSEVHIEMSNCTFLGRIFLLIHFKNFAEI